MDLHSVGRTLGDLALRVGKAAAQGALSGARRSAPRSSEIRAAGRRRSNNGSRRSNSRRVIRRTATSTRSGPDFTGRAPNSYSPSPNGVADPGEVVWAWVPYEEDHSRGKDRPALIIGRDESWLLALQVTSKDHDRDADQEARAGRRWMDIGAGGWDRQRRPSEVRLDRIVRLDAEAVRREGAALERERFDDVLREVNRLAPLSDR